MKILAFYLPQYHPIPENDAWWGPGFTEWTNVARARPLFRGHHQPRIPADLGFYDLRLAETRAAQAELARAHGVGGFCYYHYWFDGKLLLERPFDEVLASGEPDFPFCLCWANENWSRRWDGAEHELLMEQRYDRYDPAAHFRWLSRAFADPRYVTVHGRPLFLVYNAGSIPDPARVLDGWREAAREMGVAEPFVCGVLSPRNSMGYDDLAAAGFDAVTEFYPTGRRPLSGVLKTGAGGTMVEAYRKVREIASPLLPERQRPAIQSYAAVVAEAMHNPPGEGGAFPCVMPSWDNTARRGRRATIIQNDDADLYGSWLAHALRRAAERDPEEQIVFINAWNEWGEGCHLEPDLRNGRRFLEATRDAVRSVADSVVKTGVEG